MRRKDKYTDKRMEKIYEGIRRKDEKEERERRMDK